MADEMYESKSFLQHMRSLRGAGRLQSPEHRRRKAGKILAVLRDAAQSRGRRLCELHALDVGCSNGLITAALAAHFRTVVGIDPDRQAIEAARPLADRTPNLKVRLGSAMALPFQDASFDVVWCNHVYEHVPSAEKLVSEIHRALKSDGFAYFSAGNRYKVMEDHYRLPFLSWLPRPLASAYVRLFRRAEGYEERLYSWWQLKRLLGDFEMADYTLELIKEPARFQMTDLVGPGSLPTRLPRWLLRVLEPVIPTYVFILTKRQGGQ